MIVSFGLFVLSSYAIKTICVQKITDNSWIDGEKQICQRHGYL